MARGVGGGGGRSRARGVVGVGEGEGGGRERWREEGRGCLIDLLISDAGAEERKVHPGQKVLGDSCS